MRGQRHLDDKGLRRNQGLRNATGTQSSPPLCAPQVGTPVTFDPSATTSSCRAASRPPCRARAWDPPKRQGIYSAVKGSFTPVPLLRVPLDTPIPDRGNSAVLRILHTRFPSRVSSRWLAEDHALHSRKKGSLRFSPSLLAIRPPLFSTCLQRRLGKVYFMRPRFGSGQAEDGDTRRETRQNLSSN